MKFLKILEIPSQTQNFQIIPNSLGMNKIKILKKQLQIPVKVSTTNMICTARASALTAEHLRFVETNRHLFILTREFLEPTISVFDPSGSDDLV